MPSSLHLLFLSPIQFLFSWRVLIRAWYTRETDWRIREFSWLDRRSKGIISRLIPPPLFSLPSPSSFFFSLFFPFHPEKESRRLMITLLCLMIHPFPSYDHLLKEEVCLEWDCYTWNAYLSIRLWFSHEIKSWREIKKKNDINTYHSFRTSITWEEKEEEECLTRIRSLIKSGIWGKGEKMNEN